jgi:hypothetical protein
MLRSLTFRRFPIVLLTVLAVLAGGCDTDDDDDDASLIGSWKLTAATYDPPFVWNDTVYTDALPHITYGPCSMDDLFIFQSGGVFISDTGVLHCDSAEAQQTSHTWVLNGTDLTLTQGGEETVLTSVNISATSFTASVLVEETYNTVLTFTRQ